MDYVTIETRDSWEIVDAIYHRYSILRIMASIEYL